jgi:hypothetical protein
MSRLSTLAYSNDAPIHGLTDIPSRLLPTDIGCGTPEMGVQYLQDPGHRGVLREDIDGEREELQKELDLARKLRKHSSIPLKRSREIEGVFKRGAFALVDASDALGKSKRDAGISLLSAFTQKERATISLVGAVEAE